MAAGNVDFGNILSTTFNNVLPTLSDSVTKQSQILNYMKGAGRIQTEDGGAQIQESVAFSTNGTYQRYQGSSSWTLDNNKFATSALYARKFAAVPVVVLGSETTANSGKSAFVDLIAEKISNARAAMGNGLSADMYSDGTDSLQMGGLQYLISATPTTGIVGGIDRSDAANIWWRNYAESKSVTKDTILADFNKAIKKTSRNNDRVKVAITDNSTEAKLLSALTALQRFTDGESADAGFQMLSVQGIKVMNDQCMNGSVPTGYTFFINPDYLKYRPNAARNFGKIEKVHSLNQDAYVETMLWAGNLTMRGGEFHGVLVDEAASF